MIEIVTCSSSFFSDLIEESNQINNLSTKEEVKVYLKDFLIKLTSNHSLIEFDKSLSILYLEASQNENHQNLKLVGDTCLFMLGLYPMSKPQHKSLYYDLGPSSYKNLENKAKVYNLLASNFNRAVNLLLGVNILLNNNPQYKCNLWFNSREPFVKKQLNEQNIIPLGSKNEH